ncbi:hypothetical protein [Pannonibacter carbonis]|uniref:hypothetical protein n=1 Tax=Pannonibacter carbonis TaxID=2067569 RepID=UPI000D110C3A|nr:hypothetical protein [Pannonibacter carbonis]
MTLPQTPAPDPSAHLRHRLAPGAGSGLLVVVYSQVRVPDGKFGLERMFSATRHACLFLNDTRNGWYLGQEVAIDAAIEAAIASVRPARILHYGASMGGYAALVTGLRRGDGAIHAFGPELELGRPGSQSALYGLPHPGTPAEALALDPALDGLRRELAHPVHLYFGHLDPVDSAGVARVLAQGLGGRLFDLASCHASHDHLYTLNVIRKITRTFDRDPDEELTARGLIRPLPRAFHEGFAAAGEAFAAGERLTPEQLDALAAFAPGHVGLLRLRAEAAARVGDLALAVDLMQAAEAAIAQDPALHGLPKRWRKDLPLARASWLLALGQIDAALALLANCRETFGPDERIDALWMAAETGRG